MAVVRNISSRTFLHKYSVNINRFFCSTKSRPNSIRSNWQEKFIMGYGDACNLCTLKTGAEWSQVEYLTIHWEPRFKNQQGGERSRGRCVLTDNDSYICSKFWHRPWRWEKTSRSSCKRSCQQPASWRRRHRRLACQEAVVTVLLQLLTVLALLGVAGVESWRHSGLCLSGKGG